MGIFDAMKMPDLSAIGERLTNFINAASAKMDAQTAAIKMLAEQVKVQNGLLYEIRTTLRDHYGHPANDVADAADINGTIHNEHDAGGSFGLGTGGVAEQIDH